MSTSDIADSLPITEMVGGIRAMERARGSWSDAGARWGPDNRYKPHKLTQSHIIRIVPTGTERQNHSPKEIRDSWHYIE